MSFDPLLIKDTLQGQRILVTGASGFIGGHLARCLCEMGHHPVLWGRRLAGNAVDAGEVATWVPFDLWDEAEMERRWQKSAPDLVFHLAGSRSSQAQDAVRTNVEVTARLLELAGRSRTCRVVMVGSAAEYGAQSGPWHEDDALRPNTIYGVTRAAATQLAVVMHRTKNLPVVVLRLFTVYGPRQPRDMFVAQSVEHAIQNQESTIRVPSHRQDLVFIDDVVHGLLLAALTPGVEGRVFNLGSGSAPTLGQIQAQIRALASEHPPTWEEEKDDEDAPRAIIEQARRYLGWKPKTPLKEGLKVTIDWARRESAKSTN